MKNFKDIFTEGLKRTIKEANEMTVATDADSLSIKDGATDETNQELSGLPGDTDTDADSINPYGEDPNAAAMGEVEGYVKQCKDLRNALPGMQKSLMEGKCKGVIDVKFGPLGEALDTLVRALELDLPDELTKREADEVKNAAKAEKAPEQSQMTVAAM